jgi:hypothetical protein
VALSNAAAALAPNQTLASITSATTFTCLTGGGCSQLVIDVTGNISNATITLVGDATVISSSTLAAITQPTRTSS